MAPLPTQKVYGLLSRENQKGYGLEIPGPGEVRGDTFLKIGLCGKEQDPCSLSPTLFPEC